MFISIQKKELMQVLSRAQNVVEKRNTSPVLVNVMLETTDHELHIFATDLEVSLTDVAQCTVYGKGKAVVHARNLFDIVKELDDEEIQLKKLENNWLEITQGKSLFHIVGMSDKEYPVFPTFSTKSFFSIPPKTLSEMIEKTIYSVSTDETRYHLNGVFFENKLGEDLRMVSTDGHRLCLVERELKASEALEHPAFQKGVIIPRKGLNELKKLIESSQDPVEMALEGAQLVAKSGKTVLMIRLIEGQYPNFEQFLPKEFNHKIEINREKFLSSLKRVSLLSTQNSKGVMFHLTDNKLEITSHNPQMGDAKEELEVNYAGESLKIGFNAKFIIDVLTSTDKENIFVHLQNDSSPGVIKPAGDDRYTCVVMPMKF